MNKSIRMKYLVLSDIHFGHNINKTCYIVENLNKFFHNYSKELENLHVIFIAGDIFDRLLSNSSQDYILATEWLTELILFCKNNNIKLRILEGTPSHDWKQAKLISAIISKLKVDIDYKYIDTLLIEYMEEYKLHVLYIPDEYKPKAIDTLKEVKKKLKEMKLTQVDIAIMHGQFHYQLPMIKLDSSHTEEEYLNLVKRYISIGHIHTPSIYNRIIAQGSFDRLAHNEEETKGGVIITLSDTNGDTYKFLNNNNAMVFKTIKFKDESIDKICTKVRKILKDLPINSNIRIIANNEEYLHKSIAILSKEYTGYRLKAERVKKDKPVKLISKEIISNSLIIREDNIRDLLMGEIKKYNLSSDEIRVLNEELDVLIQK